MKPKSLRFLFPLLLFIVGVVWVWMSVFEYGLYAKAGPKSGFFPAIIGLGMAVFALLDMLDVLKLPAGDVSFKMFIPIFSIVAIILTAYLIGTFPAVFLFVLLWLRVYEKYDWKTTLITAVSVTAVTWFVFGYWIQVDFERGALHALLTKA